MSKTRTLYVGALALACAFLTGCIFPHHHSHPHGMPPGHAKRVGHVHGHRCGHVFVSGRWIVHGR